MRSLVKAIAGISLAASLGGCAGPVVPFTARLVDGSRRPLPEAQAGGRTIALGKPGAIYQVEVSNNTDEPVGVFVSIDGLDGSSGRAAAWEPDRVVYRRAHCFPAWTYSSIVGFDLTPTSKSTYGFIDAPHSFAAQSGLPAQAIGKIEVGIYALVRDDRPWTNPHDPDDYAVSPLASSAASSGTTPPPSPPATVGFGKVTSEPPSTATVPYQIDRRRELRHLVLYYAGDGGLALGTVGPPPDAVTLGRVVSEAAENDENARPSNATPPSTTPAPDPAKPEKPGKPLPGKNPDKHEKPWMKPGAPSVKPGKS